SWPRSGCVCSSCRPRCSEPSSLKRSRSGKSARRWPGERDLQAGDSDCSRNRAFAGSLPAQCYRDCGAAGRIRIAAMRESEKLDMASETGGAWGGLRLLPTTAWIALVLVLAVIAAVAVIGDGVGRFIAMTVVSLVLLAVIVRLFAGEAARQRALRIAAEQ